MDTGPLMDPVAVVLLTLLVGGIFTILSLDAIVFGGGDDERSDR